MRGNRREHIQEGNATTSAFIGACEARSNFGILHDYFDAKETVSLDTMKSFEANEKVPLDTMKGPWTSLKFMVEVSLRSCFLKAHCLAQ
jgi:hypothetical protein